MDQNWGMFQNPRASGLGQFRRLKRTEAVRSKIKNKAWPAPRKRGFCQQTDFGLEQQLFPEAEAAGLACRFWAYQASAITTRAHTLRWFFL